MSILKKLGRVVNGEPLGQVLSDAIANDIPWEDLVTSTSITNIRNALLKSSPRDRKQIVKSILTGFCSVCMHTDSDCACTKAIKKR